MLSPQRIPIHDRARIHAALKSDGVVVLTDVSSDLKPDTESEWRAAAELAPRTVFGHNLRVQPKVAGVHLEHRELEKKTQEAGGFSYTKAALLPHTDGYIYGDYYPDYILLLVENQSEQGGESFVVDGEKVLDRLRNDPQTAQYLPLLETTDVDLTEREPKGIANGLESQGPIVRRVNGRLEWRRQVTVAAGEACAKGEMAREEPGPYHSLWEPLSEDPRAMDMLRALDRAVQEEAKVAPRFRVQRGEALIVDNFRMLHARESYSGTTERRLWRIWVWTQESLGIPEGMAHVTKTTDASKL